MRKILPILLMSALVSSCILLTTFDPNDQPCDDKSECSPNFVCLNGKCRNDAGVKSDAGVSRDAGTDGG